MAEQLGLWLGIFASIVVISGAVIPRTRRLAARLLAWVYSATIGRFKAYVEAPRVDVSSVQEDVAALWTQQQSDRQFFSEEVRRLTELHQGHQDTENKLISAVVDNGDAITMINTRAKDRADEMEQLKQQVASLTNLLNETRDQIADLRQVDARLSRVVDRLDAALGEQVAVAQWPDTDTPPIVAQPIMYPLGDTRNAGPGTPGRYTQISSPPLPESNS